MQSSDSRLYDLKTNPKYKSDDTQWRENGNVWTYTFKVPDDDTVYEVYEANAGSLGYYTCADNSVLVKTEELDGQSTPQPIIAYGSDKNTAKIANTMQQDTLTVRKSVTGSDTNKAQYSAFDVTVNVEGFNGSVAIKDAPASDGEKANPDKITVENGTGTAKVWLQDGNSFSIALPEGATYAVSEQDEGNFTETYQINGDDPVQGCSVSERSLTANTTIAFDNQELKDVTVTKEWEGKALQDVTVELWRWTGSDDPTTSDYTAGGADEANGGVIDTSKWEYAGESHTFKTSEFANNVTSVSHDFKNLPAYDSKGPIFYRAYEPTTGEFLEKKYKYMEPSGALTVVNKNTFTDTGTALVQVAKDIQGRNWRRDGNESYEFQIRPKTGDAPMPSSESGSTDKGADKATASRSTGYIATFEPIKFETDDTNESKEFEYEVFEVIPPEATATINGRSVKYSEDLDEADKANATWTYQGMTYSTKKYSVKITYTATTQSENDKPKLTATVSYVGLNDGMPVPTFTNAYDAKASVAIPIAKRVPGYSGAKGDFLTFRVEPMNGAPSPEQDTVTLEYEDDDTGIRNDIKRVDSPAIPIKLSDLQKRDPETDLAYDLFLYRITELPGGNEKFSYDDDDEIYVRMKVADNGEGELKTTYEYFSDPRCHEDDVITGATSVDAALFTNSLVRTVNVTKVWEGVPNTDATVKLQQAEYTSSDFAALQLPAVVADTDDETKEGYYKVKIDGTDYWVSDGFFPAKMGNYVRQVPKDAWKDTGKSVMWTNRDFETSESTGAAENTATKTVEFPGMPVNSGGADANVKHVVYRAVESEAPGGGDATRYAIAWEDLSDEGSAITFTVTNVSQFKGAGTASITAIKELQGKAWDVGSSFTFDLAPEGKAKFDSNSKTLENPLENGEWDPTKLATTGSGEVDTDIPMPTGSNVANNCQASAKASEGFVSTAQRQATFGDITYTQADLMRMSDGTWQNDFYYKLTEHIADGYLAMVKVGSEDDPSNDSSEDLYYNVSGTPYRVLKDVVYGSGVTDPSKYEYWLDASSGIAYSSDEHIAHVHVELAGGELRTEVSYDGKPVGSTSPVFTNYYDAYGLDTAAIIKHIAGRDWNENDKFRFYIRAIGGAIMDPQTTNDVILLNTLDSGKVADADTWITAAAHASSRTVDGTDADSADRVILTGSAYYHLDELTPATADDEAKHTVKGRMEGWFVHAITEIDDDSVQVNGGEEAWYKANDLSYDANTIYMQTHVWDNGNGTLSNEHRYFSDATCRNEITGHVVWVDGQGNPADATVLSAIKANGQSWTPGATYSYASADADTGAQVHTTYKCVNAAYFTNDLVADIPVRKVWTDGYPMEDVTIQLFRAALPESAGSDEGDDGESNTPKLTWTVVPGTTHVYDRDSFFFTEDEASAYNSERSLSGDDAVKAGDFKPEGVLYTFEDMPLFSDDEQRYAYIAVEQGNRYTITYSLLTKDESGNDVTKAIEMNGADNRPTYGGTYFTAGQTGALQVANAYNPEGSRVVTVVKQLSGRQWESDDAFTFEMTKLGAGTYDSDGNLNTREDSSADYDPTGATKNAMPAPTGSSETTATASNTAAGEGEREASFGGISFSLENLTWHPTLHYYQGDFFYTLNEKVPTNAVAVTKDGAELKVGADGKIADSGSALTYAKAKQEGWLASFRATDNDDTSFKYFRVPITTDTVSSADGEKAYDGLIYDAAVHTVHFRVEDHRAGSLIITAAYDESILGDATTAVQHAPVFVNYYGSESTNTAAIMVKKQKLGGEWSGVEYDFTMQPLAGAPFTPANPADASDTTKFENGVAKTTITAASGSGETWQSNTFPALKFTLSDLTLSVPQGNSSASDNDKIVYSSGQDASPGTKYGRFIYRIHEVEPDGAVNHVKDKVEYDQDNEYARITAIDCSNGEVDTVVEYFSDAACTKKRFDMEGKALGFAPFTNLALRSVYIEKDWFGVPDEDVTIHLLRAEIEDGADSSLDGLQWEAVGETTFTVSEFASAGRAVHHIDNLPTQAAMTGDDGKIKTVTYVYRVVEDDPKEDGFTTTYSRQDTRGGYGTADKPLEVDNNSKFSGAGQAYLQAVKRLDGRDILKTDNFQIHVEAVTNDAPLPQETKVDGGTTNTEPQDTVTATVVNIKNQGLATFAPITYTQDNLERNGSGKLEGDFVYKLTEVVPDDAVNEQGKAYSTPEGKSGPWTKAGVTYPDVAYFAKVHVESAGGADASITTTVSYFTDEGCTQAISESMPYFTNTYASQVMTRGWVVKHINGRAWSSYTAPNFNKSGDYYVASDGGLTVSNGEDVGGDAFQFTITGIGGAAMHPTTSGLVDNVWTTPVMTTPDGNAAANPGADADKLDVIVLKTDADGNPTDVAMRTGEGLLTSDALDANGDAYFLYAINEKQGVTYTLPTGSEATAAYDVAAQDDLDYDDGTIYLLIEAHDNWDGTIRYENKYYKDAACTQPIDTDTTNTVYLDADDRLVDADAVGARAVQAAYFENERIVDIPVTKTWKGAPVEDVTLHLERALVDADTSYAVAKGSFDDGTLQFSKVGYSFTLPRAYFLNDDGSPLGKDLAETEVAGTPEGTKLYRSTDSEGNVSVRMEVAGFNQDLPMFVKQDGTEKRAVYRLTEDKTSDAYVQSQTDDNDDLFFYDGTGADGVGVGITNTTKATNTANIAAVKQLVGRTWLSDDDFKFQLEPLGRGTYGADGNLATDDDGLVYAKTGEGTAVDKNIPMPKADSSRNSTTEADKSKSVTSATSTTVTVDNNEGGRYERLARFGAIEFSLDDLQYVNGKYRGDFFYKMTEVVPDGDDTKGITYSTKKSTVHVSVQENRSEQLTVQVAYDETTLGDVSTGTQFTPVFTNRYSADASTALKVHKYLMGRSWQPNETFDFEIRPMGSAPFVGATYDNVAYLDGNGMSTRIGTTDTTTTGSRSRNDLLNSGYNVVTADGGMVVRAKASSETGDYLKQAFNAMKWTVEDLNWTVGADGAKDVADRYSASDIITYSDGHTVPAQGLKYQRFIYAITEVGASATDLMLDEDTEYLQVTAIDKGDGTLDLQVAAYEDRYGTTVRHAPNTTTGTVDYTAFVNQARRNLTVTKKWVGPALGPVDVKLQYALATDGVDLNDEASWCDAADASWWPAGVATTVNIPAPTGSDSIITGTFEGLPMYANVEGAGGAANDLNLDDTWIYYRIVETTTGNFTTSYPEGASRYTEVATAATRTTNLTVTNKSSDFSGTAQLQAQKVLEGRDIVAEGDNADNFKLLVKKERGPKSVDDMPLPKAEDAFASSPTADVQAQTKSQGIATFKDITFTQDMLVAKDGIWQGDFVYKISEVVPTGAVNRVYKGVTYSDVAYYAKVHVESPTGTANALSTQVSYYQDAACQTPIEQSLPVFTNTYDASGKSWAHVIKHVNGRDIVTSSSTPDQFSFAITNVGGSVMRPTGDDEDEVNEATKTHITKPMNYDGNGTLLASGAVVDGKVNYAATSDTASSYEAVLTGEGLFQLSNLKNGYGQFVYEIREPETTDYVEFDLENGGTKTEYQVNKVADLDYDSRIIYLRYTVEDNGDGTLDVKPEYFLDAACIYPLTVNGNTPQVLVSKSNGTIAPASASAGDEYEYVPAAFFENSRTIDIKVEKDWVGVPTEDVTVHLERALFPVSMEDALLQASDADAWVIEHLNDEGVRNWHGVGLRATLPKLDFWDDAENKAKAAANEEISRDNTTVNLTRTVETDDDAGVTTIKVVYDIADFDDNLPMYITGDGTYGTEAGTQYRAVYRLVEDDTSNAYVRSYRSYDEGRGDTDETRYKDGDQIFVDSGRMIVVNDSTATTGTANIGAVKQLVGRDWNTNERFDFVLEPLGKADYDARGELQTAAGDLTTDADMRAGVKLVDNSAYSIPKPGSPSASATKGDTIATTSPRVGEGELLASFGGITYSLADLEYDARDHHSQGDFYYTMREQVPDTAIAVVKSGANMGDPVKFALDGGVYVESGADDAVTLTYKDATKHKVDTSQYYWMIPKGNAGFNGLMYDGTVHLVHVKVRENRTGTLQVQVIYDQDNASDSSTGKQFVPVFTNRYVSDGELVLSATKAMNNRVMQTTESYTVRVLPLAGSPMPYVNGKSGSRLSSLDITLTGDGSTNKQTASAAVIPLEAEGTYLYELYEVLPDGAGDNGVDSANNVSYDLSHVYAQVVVKDQPELGVMASSVRYYSDSSCDDEYLLTETAAGASEGTPVTSAPFTNTALRDIRATKLWKGDAVSAVTLTLESSTDGTNWTSVASREIAKDATGDELVAKFSDVPAYAVGGGLVQYRVVETAGEGFVADAGNPKVFANAATGEGFTTDAPQTVGDELIGSSVVITNTNTTTRTFTGTKLWVDGGKDHTSDAAPTLVLRRTADEAPSDPSEGDEVVVDNTLITLTWDADKSTFTYEGLPTFASASGKRYTYWATEATVSGYDEPTYENLGNSVHSDRLEDGGTVTNTLKQAYKDITVKKVWNDVQAGDTPPSIIVNLLAASAGGEAQPARNRDGNVIGPEMVTSTSAQVEGLTWTLKYEGVPEYDSERYPITYSVTEGHVPGYAATITGNQTEGFTITNAKHSSTLPDVLQVQKAVDNETAWVEAFGHPYASDKWPDDAKFVFSLQTVSAPEGVTSQPMPNDAELQPDGTVRVTINSSGETSKGFGTITFDEPGDYVYFVRELTPSEANMEQLPGMTYDGNAYTVTVTVDNDMTITADSVHIVDKEGAVVTKNDSGLYVLTFKNSYNPDEVEYPISAEKEYEDYSGLTAIGDVDGAFDFTLKPVDTLGENSGVVTSKSENPMPTDYYTFESGTGLQGNNGDRVYYARNQEGSVQFYRDVRHALKFTKDMIAEGQTEGNVYSYEIAEVIPDAAKYIGNGFWYDEDSQLIYDGVVHVRQLQPRLVPGRNAIEVVAVNVSTSSSHDDTYLNPPLGTTYKAAASDSSTPSASWTDGERVRHGGKVPRFLNYKAPSTTVTATKVWDDVDNADKLRPANTYFTISRSDGKQVVDMYGTVLNATVKVAGADSTGCSLTAQWPSLPLYERTSSGAYERITYTVAETAADGATMTEPFSGYDMAEVEGDDTAGFTITNTHAPAVRDITVTKAWDDDEDRDRVRPASVTFHIAQTADGKTTTLSGDDKVASNEDDWKVSWTGLPENVPGADGAAAAYSYTLSEDEVAGYTAGGFVVGDDGYGLRATLEWDDGYTGEKPQHVNVSLLDASGEPVGSPVALGAENDWTAHFDGLTKGEALAYSVSTPSLTVAQSAASRLTVATVTNYSVTNTYAPLTTSVTAVKVWADDDNRDGKRPAVKLQLQRQVGDGEFEKVEDYDITSTMTGDALAHVWDGLPTHQAGVPVAYQVVEVDEDGLLVSEDTSKVRAAGYLSERTGTAEVGFTFTNTYAPERGSLKVAKIWVDTSDVERMRASVKVHLYKTVDVDGVSVKTPVDVQTLTVADDASVQWDNLFVYEGGQTIEYSVEEETVNGYRAASDGASGIVLSSTNTPDNPRTVSFTNTHAVEDVDFTVRKVWADTVYVDGEPAFGPENRPDSVTIRVTGTAQGSAGTKTRVQDVVISPQPADKNKAVWEETVSLPKYVDVDDSAAEEYVAYSYSVSEPDVPANYQESLLFSNTVVNTYGMVTFAGTKVWRDDGHTHDNASEVVLTLERTTGDASATDAVWSAVSDPHIDWVGNRFVIRALPAKDASGVDYTYRVTEQQVGGGYDAPSYSNEGNADAAKAVETRFIYSGGTIVNAMDVVSVFGSVVWNDGDNSHVSKDESKLVLYRTSSPDGTGEEVVGVSPTWGEGANADAYSFVGLPRKDSNGADYVYYVKQQPISGFTTTYSNAAGTDTSSAKNGGRIVNERADGVMPIEVKVKWDDSDNAERQRPVSVGITLYKKVGGNDPVAVGSPVEVTAADNWTVLLRDLPRYENGQPVEYSVAQTSFTDADGGAHTSLSAVGYRGQAGDPSGSAEDGFVFTNARDSGLVSITATKQWDDASDASMRGDVTLYLVGTADGWVMTEPRIVATGDAHDQQMTAAWEAPLYHDGVPVHYEVVEAGTDGYFSTVVPTKDEEREKAFTVTNKPVGQSDAISVTKTWFDADDQDGKRSNVGARLQLQKRVGANGAWANVADDDEVLAAASMSVTATGADGSSSVVVSGEKRASYSFTGSLDVSSVAVSWTGLATSADASAIGVQSSEAGSDGEDVAIAAEGEGAEPAEAPETSVAEAASAGGIPDAPVASPDALADASGDGDEADGQSGDDVLPASEGESGGWPSLVEKAYADDAVAVQDAGSAPVYYRVVELNADGSAADDPKGAIASNGYTSVSAQTSASSFAIYNVKTPETRNITVTKVWIGDDEDIEHGAVTVSLTKGGAPVPDTTAHIIAGTPHTWANLPVYEHGVRIDYGVVEYDVPEGYIASYASAGDDFVVSNAKLNMESKVVVATKAWNDRGQEGVEHPAVTLRLMKKVGEDGGLVDAGRPEKVIAAGASGDDLVVTWGGDGEEPLPAYEGGRIVTYSVREDEVEGYSATYSDGESLGDGVVAYTVTNIRQDASGGTGDYVGDVIMVTYVDHLNAAGDQVVAAYKAYSGDVDASALSREAGYGAIAKYYSQTSESYVDAAQLETDLVTQADGAAADNYEPGRVPADPSHDGYVFAGWAQNKDPYGNYVMVAQYEEIEYAIVSYVDCKAADALVQTSRVAASEVNDVAAPADPSHEGYAFKGWAKVKDAAGNYIYVAQYEGAGPAGPANPGNAGGDPSAGTHAGEARTRPAAPGSGSVFGSLPTTGDKTMDAAIVMGLIALLAMVIMFTVRFEMRLPAPDSPDDGPASPKPAPFAPDAPAGKDGLSGPHAPLHAFKDSRKRARNTEYASDGLSGMVDSWRNRKGSSFQIPRGPDLSDDDDEGWSEWR